MFKLNDPEPVLIHEEIIRMNGDIVGYISSGAFGFTLGRSVGMGYVNHADGVTKELIESADWEIEIACERFQAEASLRAFFDPTGERIKG
jgi:glycine cleavage system aminomethyltransferase T